MMHSCYELGPAGTCPQKDGVNVSVKLEQNWNKMRTNENKLEHDNLWLCVACLLLETVGQVSRNASGWNLFVVKLPKF